MAAPNIVNVSTIIGESQGFQLDTTTTTALLTVASDKLVKINRISVANIDGTNAADVTVGVDKATRTSESTDEAELKSNKKLNFKVKKISHFSLTII